MNKRIFITIFLLTAFYCCCTQAQNTALRVKNLTGNYYIYTTWKVLEDGPFPANGMYIVTKDGVVMIDAPWDTTQTENLLNLIDRKHHQKVVLCIATHSHEDRTGSFELLKRHGVKTYTSTQTLEECIKHKYPKPEFTFSKDTLFVVGGVPVRTYYPGEGHTKDNIVVWCKDEQLLYGGCFVKSTEATTLGYIDEANLKAWPVSIKNVMEKYPEVRFIIPGHQDWHSLRSLQHTLDLLEKNKQ